MLYSMAYLKQESHTKISCEAPFDTSTELFRFVYVCDDRVNVGPKLSIYVGVLTGLLVSKKIAWKCCFSTYSKGLCSDY